MDTNALQQQSGKIAAGMAVVAVLFLIVRSLAFPEPPIPINQANGTYANDCCGTISLSDGTMRFGKREVTYVIERDKGGAYILPQQYVGIYPGQGLQIEQSRSRLKLRLDDEKRPQTISILGSDKEYLFTR
jgi:hypothetical protein